MYSRRPRSIRGRAWSRIRLAVLSRANWRCEKCGRAGALEIHHVNHNPDDNDLGNLEAWCRTEHIEHHRRHHPRQNDVSRAWRRLVDELRH